MLDTCVAQVVIVVGVVKRELVRCFHAIRPTVHEGVGYAKALQMVLVWYFY